MSTETVERERGDLVHSAVRTVESDAQASKIAPEAPAHQLDVTLGEPDRLRGRSPGGPGAVEESLDRFLLVVVELPAVGGRT